MKLTCAIFGPRFPFAFLYELPVAFITIRLTLYLFERNLDEPIQSTQNCNILSTDWNVKRRLMFSSSYTIPLIFN